MLMRKSHGKTAAANVPQPKAKPVARAASRRISKAAKPLEFDAKGVTLKSLELGNGGAVIRVSERQAASLKKLGNPAD
jgi:hypothetical protein